MRGEETQLYGLDWDGLVLLPGTHNKWVWMQEKEIVHFKTVMTGEIFGLLQKNGLIGSLMNNEEGNDFNELSFSEGIMVSKERGGLLHQLFSVRARGVQGKSEGLIDYLSGLLIGTELLSQEVCSPLLIIGNERLYARYRRGIELLFPNISIHYESEDTAVIRGANCIWEKFYA
jgi:2-dehydro-3-deoxygalactonokinase